MTQWQSKIKEYKEYTRLMEELQELKDSIADELKAMMQENGTSKITVGEYKLTYAEVTRTDIDKKRLQAEHGELYSQYQKQTTYMRFAVS